MYRVGLAYDWKKLVESADASIHFQKPLLARMTQLIDASEINTSGGGKKKGEKKINH